MCINFSFNIFDELLLYVHETVIYKKSKQYPFIYAYVPPKHKKTRLDPWLK